MRTFSEAFAHLAALESFKEDAFEPNTEFPEDFCSFVLAISVVYNDIKNLDIISEILKSAEPGKTFNIQPDFGEYNGIHLYLNKLRIGIVYELMELISRNKKVLESDKFATINQKMPKDARDAWTELVDTAFDKGRKSKTNVFFMIRNKLSFHYGADQIQKGFRHKRSLQPDMKPMISRGRNMLETRFYFADMAVEGYFNMKLADASYKDFLSQLHSILDKLNRSLYFLITCFINARSPWKSEKTQDRGLIS